uniref:Reverse transcriptase zinc-binding domain-containing protein n=1 Tax=Lactuca sativa TaxID=4236 RepID=A0A9R1V4N6_LACSA|nr:hypothetical protein LSAT_V11C600319660 [Lactuca sativa]
MCYIGGNHVFIYERTSYATFSWAWKKQPSRHHELSDVGHLKWFVRSDGLVLGGRGCRVKLCSNGVDESDHLVGECSFAIDTFSWVFNWCGILHGF